MIKYILFSIAGFIAIVVAGVSVYLGPDDLRGCAKVEALGSCSAADAIVVVSGGDTAARVDEALRLYREGWADKLIFSGAAADPDSPSNAKAMERQALADGVPQDAITVEELSRTTAENARNTSKFITSGSFGRIVLVTSVYHQRRAYLEFKTALGENVTIINHPVSHDKQWPGFWWWTTPRGWWLAGGELIKIVVFYATQWGTK